MPDHLEHATRSSRRSNVYRRILDLLISGALAIITLPIVLIAAVGSAISLRAWPFFSQERVGRHGETFRFLKIRTLPLTVPTYTDKYQLGGHDIPRFCQALRRLHLDELPQLYLVVMGRMALVGPRPEMRYLHDQMPAEFSQQRTMVRPGCTGLWQVSSSCTGLISAAPEYDCFYLTHRSLRLDVWILFRTALKMTGLANSVALTDVPRWTLPSEGVTAARVIDLRDSAVEDSETSGIAVSAGR